MKALDNLLEQYEDDSEENCARHCWCQKSGWLFRGDSSHVDVYPNPLYKTTTAMPRIDIPPGMKNGIYLREMPPPWRLPECDGSTYSSSTKPGGYIICIREKTMKLSCCCTKGCMHADNEEWLGIRSKELQLNHNHCTCYRIIKVRGPKDVINQSASQSVSQSVSQSGVVK